ncbi:malectin domain-containing carbohydrate-binding protein [Hyphococcus luteus]|uniref:malectin domain-containing carbohydrate-binding protein n=1 Tax=Hyphococcus luteus TaxID=2058213 RepID=UPI000D526D21|nr:malectin domain-containing carbohydrate-binding protein [Marinicaulis flavus]
MLNGIVDATQGQISSFLATRFVATLGVEGFVGEFAEGLSAAAVDSLIDSAQSIIAVRNDPETTDAEKEAAEAALVSDLKSALRDSGETLLVNEFTEQIDGLLGLSGTAENFAGVIIDPLIEEAIDRALDAIYEDKADEASLSARFQAAAAEVASSYLSEFILNGIGLEGDSFAEQFGAALVNQFATNVINGTLGIDDAQLFDSGGVNFDQIFNKIPEMSARLIISSLTDKLGLDGVGAVLFNEIGTELITTIGNNAINGNADLLEGFKVDDLGPKLGQVAVSFASTKLAAEIANNPAGELGAKIGGLVGSTIGNLLPGGSLVWEPVLKIIGAVIGNLFGTTPRSGADLVYNRQIGEFVVGASYKKGKGDRELAEQIAGQAGETLNSVLAAVGGELLNPAEITPGHYGTYKDRYQYRENGREDVADKSFTSIEDLVSFGVLNALEEVEVLGGDIFIKRAFHSSLEAQENPSGPRVTGAEDSAFAKTGNDLSLLLADLTVAADYSEYFGDPGVINALITSAPESAFSVGWAITFQRALELGLHRRAASDWTGGWDFFLNDQDAASVSTLQFDVDDATGERLITFTDSESQTKIVGDNIPSSGKDVIEGSAAADSIVVNGSMLDATPSSGAVTVNGETPAEDFDIDTAAVIHGGDGNDTIYGGDRGNDLYGDAGDDVLFGGATADWLFGGEGNDTLSANAGDDGNYLNGGAGADSLIGAEGSDWLSGETGADTLLGGAGDDVIDGGADIDTLRGGAGDDLYVWEAGDGPDDFLEGDADAQASADLAARIGNLASLDFSSGAGAAYRVNGYARGGVDTLVLGEGIGFDHLLFERVSTGAAYDDLVVIIDLDRDPGTADEEIVLTEWFDPLKRVEFLQLSDGQKINLGAFETFIQGTSGNDTLFGTYRSDFINGAEGDDNIYLLSGDDFGVGGAGADIITGDDDDDIVVGGDGADRLMGGNDDDRVIGGRGGDDVYGGSGNDLIVGDEGDDTLIGGYGDDIFKIARGEGRDTVYDALTDNWEAVWTQAGGYEPGYTLLDGKVFDANDDVVFDGTKWVDRWRYDWTTKTLERHLADGVNDGADQGTDRIEFGLGINLTDLFAEQVGDDLVIGIANGGAPQDINDFADGLTFKDWFSLGAPIEEFAFIGAGLIKLRALGADIASGDYAIAAGLADGVIDGDAGNNIVFGSVGDETLHGLGGVDLLLGQAGEDVLEGGAGADNLLGGGGDDVLDGGAGADILDGGAGFDIADYRNATGAVSINLGANMASGAEALNDSFIDIEGVYGGDYADSLTGDAGENELDGGDDADTLSGGLGADTYLYRLGEGGDTIDDAGDATGGDVRDTLILEDILLKDVGFAPSGSDLNLSFAGSLDAVTISDFTGNGGIEEIIFGDGVSVALDKLAATAGSGDDFVVGSTGADTLEGLDGADTLSGRGGGDVLNGGLGDDYLAPGDAASEVDGGAGVDTVYLGDLAAGVDIDLGVSGSGEETFEVVYALNVGGPEYVSPVTGITYAAHVDPVGGSLILRDQASSNPDIFDTDEDALYQTYGYRNGEGFAYEAPVGEAGEYRVTLKFAELFYNSIGWRIFDVALEGQTYPDLTDIDLRLLSGERGYAYDIQERVAVTDGSLTIAYELGSADSPVANGFVVEKVVPASGSAQYANVENIIGTALADTIAGDANANRLEGGDGDDTLAGAGGADTIIGGLGDDVVDGGSDGDVLYGDEGADNLSGGDGADLIYGGDGNDAITAGAGGTVIEQDGSGQDVTVDVANSVYGEGGDDTLTGGDDKDSLVGGAGDDVLSGGAGLDTLVADGGDDTLDGGADSDIFVIASTAQADGETRIVNAAGYDTLELAIAGTPEELWFTLSGSDLVIEAIGDPSRTVVVENWTTTGQTGLRENTADGVRTIYLNGQAISHGAVTALADALAAVSAVTPESFAGLDANQQQAVLDAHAAAWQSRGSYLDNETLTGGMGDDTLAADGNLTGGAFIDGAEGDDSMTGAGENDTIFGGDGADTLFGLDGDDLLDGGDGSSASIGEQGLTAAFFGLPGSVNSMSEIDFEAAPLATEVVTSIDYANGGSAFWSGGLINEFTAHFTGVLNVTTAGNYTFYLSSDDGSQLSIDGSAVVDNDSPHSYRTQSATVYLEAGSHAIDVRYFENYGSQGLKLEWESADAGITREVISGSSYETDVIGTVESDVIDGGAGADTLIGSGSDIVTGGAGSDLYEISEAAAGVEITEAAGAAADEDVIRLGAVARLSDLVAGMGGVSASGPVAADDLVLANGKDGSSHAVLKDHATSAETVEYVELGDGSRFALSADGSAQNGVNTLIAGAAGAETLSGASGNDAVFGNDGADNLLGMGGDDALFGGAGADTLAGGDGDDILYGGAGADSLEGGAGQNWASYEDATSAVTYDGETPANGAGDAQGDILVNIYGVEGSDFDDLLRGGVSSADVFDGGAGDDTLEGRGGADTLIGGAGVDSLDGGDGFDTAVFEGLRSEYDVNTDTGAVTHIDTQVADVITNIEELQFDDISVEYGLLANNPPEIGNDQALPDQSVLVGDLYSFLFPGEQDPGAAFIDQDGDALTYSATLADGSALPAWLSFDPQTRSFSGAPPVSDANTSLAIRVTASDDYASAYNDFVLSLNARGVEIEGGSGNDTLSSIGVTGADEDTLRGFAGDDTLIGGSGGDLFEGGAGVDNVDYGDSAAAVSVDLAANTASGGDAEGDMFTEIEGVLGTAFADTLAGDAGDNVLDGRGGDDSLSGGDGADTLTGGAGTDTLLGGAGDDYLAPGDAASEVDGGDGVDTVYLGDLSESVTIDLGASGGGEETFEVVYALNIAGPEYVSPVTGITYAAHADPVEGAISLRDRSSSNPDIFDTDEDALYQTFGFKYGQGFTYEVPVDEAGEYRVTLKFAELWFNSVGSRVFDVTLEGQSDPDLTDIDIRLLSGERGYAYDIQERATVTDGALTIAYEVGSADNPVANAFVVEKVTPASGNSQYANVENIIGTGLDDAITGDAAANRLEGGDGDDTLAGAGGADTIIGGLGDDVVSYAGASSGVNVAIDGVAGTGGASGDELYEVEHLIGSDYNDTLAGNEFNNTLEGGLGDDALYGLAARDYIYGGDGADSLYGGAGGDFLYGGDGNDRIEAGSEGDRLHGEAGNDTLIGGDGNDVYFFGRDTGQDVVDNYDTDGGQDVITYADDVSNTDLWFEKSGRDLVVSVLGTSSNITVTDWFNPDDTPAEDFVVDMFLASERIAGFEVNVPVLLGIMDAYGAAPADFANLPPNIQSQIEAAWGAGAPPTIMTTDDLTNIIISEDDPNPPVLTFTVGDAEDSADHLTVTAYTTASVLPQQISAQYVDPTTRQITLAPLADAFGTADVTVEVEDLSGKTDTIDFTVTVDEAADAPDLISISSPGGNENTAIALNIDAALTDMGGTEALEIQIDGPDTGWTLNNFRTDLGNGGYILDPEDLSGLTITPPADSGADIDLTVTARSTVPASIDNSNDTAETSDTFTVVVNGAPTGITLSNNTIQEGIEGDTATYGGVVGVLSSADPDGSDTFGYSIQGGPDAANFEIVNNQLKLKDTVFLDYENPADQVQELTIRTMDQGGLSFDEDVTVNVTPRDEKPRQPSAASGTIAENDAGLGLALTGSTDPDGDDVDYAFVQGGNAGGFFEITQGAGDTATLGLNQALDYEYVRNNLASLSYIKSDAGGYYLEVEYLATDYDVTALDQEYQVTDGRVSTPQTAKVYVTDENEAPENLGVSDTTHTTITSSSGAGVTLSMDEDKAKLNWDIAYLSSDDPDVYAADTSWTTSEYYFKSTAGNFSTISPDGRFKIINNRIEVAKTALNYETPGDRSNTYTIAVKDAAGEYDSAQDKQLTVNIEDVNEAPVINDQSVSVSENTPGPGVVGSFTFSDPEGDALTFTKLPAGDTEFDVNDDGDIIYTGSDPLDYETDSSYSISVEVSDGNNDPVIAAITINIIDGDDLIAVPGQPLFDLSSEAVSQGYHEVFISDNRRIRYKLTDPGGADVAYADDVLALWANIAPGYYQNSTTEYLYRSAGTGFPIVIDLGSEGITITPIGAQFIAFDIDNDGSRQRTDWVGADDGLLVLDRNGDGVIDNGSEISFVDDLAGATTDLEGLAAYDSNADGVFNAADERFSEFQIWRDANQDGVSQADELFSLAEMNIASLDLTGTPTGIEVGDPVDALILNTATFTRTDGTTGELADAVFRYSSFEEEEDPSTPASLLSDLNITTQEEENFTHETGDAKGPDRREGRRFNRPADLSGPEAGRKRYDLDGMLADLRRFTATDPFEVHKPLIEAAKEATTAALQTGAESGGLDASFSRLVQAMSSFDKSIGYDGAHRFYGKDSAASEHVNLTASSV